MIHKISAAMSRWLIITALLVGAVSPSAVGWAQPDYQGSGEDWPMLMQDAAHSGYASSTLASNQLNLKWKVGLGERLETTMQPVVAGGRVFVGVMNGKFHAIDASTGQITWTYQAGGAISHTAAVVDDTVYFGCEDGKIYALNAETGALRWTYTTAGPVLSSPVVAAGTVLIGSFDGYLYALNTNGSLKWRYHTGGRVWTSPAADEAGNRVYFGSEDMRAYAVRLDNGQLVWSTLLQGISMRDTYPVLSGNTVIFSTVKPGVESYAPWEDWPFPDSRSPVAVWNDFYHTYPERRPLYFLDTATGADRWDYGQNRYTPLPVPYWGLIVPLVDPDGNAWLPASGGGGDHALDHDDRLWKVNLATGEYTQAASQDEYMMRFDETGRHTMAGGKYYYTIDADVAVYDPQTRTKQAIFGNGFGDHRNPLDDPPTVQLHRYGGSLPFGGGVSGSSPLVIAGGVGYYISYSWLYAITPESVSSPGVVDLGVDHTAGPPLSALSYTDVKAELQTQIQQIIANGHIQPRANYWGWTTKNIYSFWHEGEVIASLARALPYLDVSTRASLENYLHSEAQTHLFNESYSYRTLCLVYGLEDVVDPCNPNDYGDEILTHWFADDLNIIAENLYAMWAYAHYTDDWSLISDNWSKVTDLFNRLRNSWDGSLDIIIERESNGAPKRWHTPDFKINLQIAAMYGASQMAAHQDDGDMQSQAESMLNELFSTRTWMGTYVPSLYDNGTFHRADAEDLIWTYDVFPYQGYRDRDSDVRQIQWMDGMCTEVFGFVHTGGSSGIISDDTPGTLGHYEDLLQYHYLFPELGTHLASHLYDETQMYVDTIENLNPWWYWSDASIAMQGGSENLFNHAHLSAAMFQTKAYVLGEEFDDLVRQLPWTFADTGYQDIYRLQNLVALMDVHGLAAEDSHKEVSAAAAEHNDILTYTITLHGSGESMTLTDPIPDGTSYVSGSASVSPNTGALSANTAQVTWAGTVAEGEPVQITFQVRVEVDTPAPIENVATLEVQGGAKTCDLRAITVANGFKAFLPLILKGER